MLGPDIFGNYWPVDAESCFPLALDNLGRMTWAPFERVSPGLFLWSGPNPHDAARQLLGEEVRRLDVRGNPVAFVCGSALLVAGSEDLAALKSALAQVQKRATEMEGFEACELRGGGWEAYVPSAAFEQKWRSARQKLLSFQYAEQAELWEMLIEQGMLGREEDAAKEADAFAHFLMKLEDDDGEEPDTAAMLGTWELVSSGWGVKESRCTWRPECLVLPQAERVQVTTEAGESFEVRWGDLMQVASGALQQQSVYPSWFKVLRPLDPGELKALVALPSRVG
ncbi:hypothetical protein BON30_34385 [Cystobacter ferrugineus]|uniref:Uncharacterized protein n=1 Tax=Cystobacter ferrugineus TaxID=83449 RepID=A0A1L9B1V7_9BACT|nr:hypothetical protein BON30_34385 [Cystobacter ferrugineus]